MLFDTEVLSGFEAETVQHYRRVECAVFRKTAESWGELSNMAAGFPLVINGIPIRTSEALYQACRFPHLPQVQREIIAQASPMAAKMKGKPYRTDSRPDFDALRVPIMWWCLRVKLASNLAAFSRILLASQDRPIVEDSHKDTFWGAKPTRDDEQLLVGQNVLGRLLRLLRDLLLQDGPQALRVIPPPAIPNFLLYNEPIRTVEENAEPA